VFFEKQRISDGKDKTELRLRQEKAFPKGRDLNERDHLWLFADEYAERDDLGRICIYTAKGKLRMIC